MKFIVEIRAAGAEGTDTVIRRFNITAINPSRAVRHARAMLGDWKKRHPSNCHARVFNGQGIELYIVQE